MLDRKQAVLWAYSADVILQLHCITHTPLQQSLTCSVGVRLSGHTVSPPTFTYSFPFSFYSRSRITQWWNATALICCIDLWLAGFFKISGGWAIKNRFSLGYFCQPVAAAPIYVYLPHASQVLKQNKGQVHKNDCSTYPLAKCWVWDGILPSGLFLATVWPFYAFNCFSHTKYASSEPDFALLIRVKVLQEQKLLTGGTIPAVYCWCALVDLIRNNLNLQPKSSSCALPKYDWKKKTPI